MTLLVSLVLLGTGPVRANEPTLEIIGPDKASYALGISELNTIPWTDLITSTPWTETATYSGPLVEDVLSQKGLSGAAISAVGIDGYRATFSWQDMKTYRPILAITRNGAPMPIRQQGPIWLLLPFDDHPAIQNDEWYFRAIWRIVRLEVHQQ